MPAAITAPVAFFDFGKDAGGGVGPDHSPRLGDRLAGAVPLGELQVDMTVAHAGFVDFDKVQTPPSKAWATAAATPFRRRESGMPLRTAARSAADVAARATYVEVLATDGVPTGTKR
jgi:hypothetical protein